VPPAVDSPRTLVTAPVAPAWPLLPALVDAPPVPPKAQPAMRSSADVELEANGLETVAEPPAAPTVGVGSDSMSQAPQPPKAFTSALSCISVVRRTDASAVPPAAELLSVAWPP